MPWIELQVTTTAALANELSDELVSLGAEAVTFKDAGDNPIYEPAPETPRLWHETIVVGLFPHDHPLEPVMQFLEAQEQIKDFQFNFIPDEDWERRCLDSFKPIQFGSRLWICPSWHTPPDPHAVNVTLDPGLAFGTGTHPTTALCLEWLDQNITSDEVVIDYGCGSGILAIAALKLGAKQVIAVDNDPQALESTRANCERNHIDSKRLITLDIDQPIEQKADVLIANILAQPLIDLAPHFCLITKKWTKIVLSGILLAQAKKVLTAYEPWYVMNDLVQKEGWVRLEGIRK